VLGSILELLLLLLPGPSLVCAVSPRLLPLLLLLPPGVLDPTHTDSAADSIGSLVWAPLWTDERAAGSSSSSSSSPSQVMWPCEAVDPFRPPRGFKLLPEHKLALTPAERRLYLPAEGGASGSVGTSAAAAAAGGGAGVGDGAAKNPVATGNEAGSPSESAAAAGGGEGGASAGRRKLLLVWFHSNQYEWRWQDELQPFRQHKAKYKRERGGWGHSGSVGMAVVLLTDMWQHFIAFPGPGQQAAVKLHMHDNLLLTSAAVGGSRG
jgi:hypothetical protein